MGGSEEESVKVNRTVHSSRVLRSALEELDVIDLPGRVFRRTVPDNSMCVTNNA